MVNTYCYPDTDTLINKLNIHSQRKLLDAETQTVSIRLYQLQVQPISGNFDFKHLCSIHNYYIIAGIHMGSKNRLILTS